MDLRSLVRRRLDDLAKVLEDAVLSGGCKDIGEYRWQTGKIDGIRRAFQEIEPLLRDEDTGGYDDNGR